MNYKEGQNYRFPAQNLEREKRSEIRVCEEAYDEAPTAGGGVERLDSVRLRGRHCRRTARAAALLLSRGVEGGREREVKTPRVFKGFESLRRLARRRL